MIGPDGLPINKGFVPAVGHPMFSSEYWVPANSDSFEASQGGVPYMSWTEEELPLDGFDETVETVETVEAVEKKRVGRPRKER